MVNYTTLDPARLLAGKCGDAANTLSRLIVHITVEPEIPPELQHKRTAHNVQLISRCCAFITCPKVAERRDTYLVVRVAMHSILHKVHDFRSLSRHREKGIECLGIHSRRVAATVAVRGIRAVTATAAVISHRALPRRTPSFLWAPSA